MNSDEPPALSSINAWNKGKLARVSREVFLILENFPHARVENIKVDDLMLKAGVGCVCAFRWLYYRGVFDLSTLCFQHMFDIRGLSLNFMRVIVRKWRKKLQLNLVGFSERFTTLKEFAAASLTWITFTNKYFLFHIQADIEQLHNKFCWNFTRNATTATTAAIPRSPAAPQHRATTRQLRPQMWFAWKGRQHGRRHLLLQQQQSRVESSSLSYQPVSQWEPPLAWF